MAPPPHSLPFDLPPFATAEQKGYSLTLALCDGRHFPGRGRTAMDAAIFQDALSLREVLKGAVDTG